MSNSNGDAGLAGVKNVLKNNLSLVMDAGWKVLVAACIAATAYVTLWGDARYADRKITERNDEQSQLVRANHEQRLVQLENAISTLQITCKEITCTLNEGTGQRMVMAESVRQILEETRGLRQAVDKTNERLLSHILKEERLINYSDDAGKDPGHLGN